ncbi:MULTISPECIES: LmeA family phospholipid-binding protein [unclassified Streptomyces]|uniref:LmeA family phospholipid-binding protein n=1 Tax=unclassified Streptomyces TaxID=2593676 RepID=UPI0033E5AD91
MRALRILLITVVILGGLFVAADRLLLNYAESEAAEKIKARQGLSGATEVAIEGFPFLTQVVGKELERVDVTVRDIETSANGRRVVITELSAALHNVRLGSNYSSATAATATGTARISYADLTKAADEDVTVAYGGNGKLKVTGTVDILGRSLSRSVVSTVSLVDGGTIRVRADKVPGEGIPRLEDMIREKTDFDRKLSGLPEGMKLQKVQADEKGLVITVAGTDVPLAG